MLYQRVRRQIDSMQGQARASRLQLEALKTKLRGVGASSLMRELERLERYRLRLDLMNPRQVLRRGYVWVHRSDGSAATQIADVRREMPLTLQFVDGQADVTVRELRQE